MTFYVPAKRKLLGKVSPKELNDVNVGYQIGKSTEPPKMPDIPETPAAPTVDTAQQNRDQQDRLRRRRGVLANIYAGQGTGSGGSGATQLGG